MKSICNLMEEAEKLAGEITKKQRTPEEAQKLISDIQKKIKEAKKAAPTVDKEYLKQVNSKLKQFAVSGSVDPATGERVPPEAIARMIVDIGNVGGISKAVREAKKVTGWDMYNEVWMNGVLSNPTSWTVNGGSNFVTILTQPVERLFASFVGKVSPGQSEIPMAEALHMTYGMIEGLKDGFKVFGRHIVNDIDPGLASKFDFQTHKAISAKNLGINEDNFFGRAVDLLGAAVRIPSRVMGSTDAVFKGVGYRAELRARSYRQAALEAKQNGWSKEQMAKRMTEITENPPDDIKLAAINAGNYVTFTKELGPAGQSAMTAMRKVDDVTRFPIMRLVAPFVRTPTNLLKYAGERTLLGFASKAVRAEIKAGGARRDLALAKMALGSTMMAITASYAADGRITGGGPKDGRLRALWRDKNQPYSIRIGDKWVSYARIDPFATLIGMAADYAEITGQANEEDRSKLAAAAAMSIVKNITSKTYLRGFSDLLQVLDEPERYGESYIANYAKSLIPAAVGQIERLEDPQLRSTYSHEGMFQEVLNAVYSKTPGYSDELPLNRNLWGEEVLLGPGWSTNIALNLWRIVNPIYTQEVTEGEPINNELLRMKYGPGKPDREQKIKGHTVRLSDWEYDKFDQLINTMEMPQTGKNLKESLNELVTEDPTYKDAETDNEKRQRIEAYIEQARGMAKEELYWTTDSVKKIVDALEMQRYIPQAVNQ